MSKRIAIAGGTGGLGKSVVDVLLTDPELEITILSRSQSSSTTKAIDYSSVDSVAEALQGIDTVVSFIGGGGAALTDSTNILIQASLKAGVKRFIPSEWAGDIVRYRSIHCTHLLFSFEPALYAPKAAVRQSLASSGLEYTLVGNGLFMDYLLPRGTKNSVRDVVIPVSVQDRKARIPGTGNEPLIMTTTEDIGKGVAALLKQPLGSWKRYSWIIGERTTWNNILQTAQQVTGKSFEVEYIPLESLQKALEQETDLMKRFYIEVDIWYTKGLSLVVNENTSDVLAGHTTTTSKQVIEQAVKLLSTSS